LVHAHRIFVLSGLLLGTPALGQNATQGGAIFAQRCQMCHGNTASATSGVGPNLYGVVNRKAGATAFAYSSALKGSNLVWDQATLDRFLSGPSKLVPGTKMPVSISDPAERTSVVTYLSTLRK